MARSNPFKRHRFPREIILLAVRWYCRYPLSCRDVRDMLAERGVDTSRVAHKSKCVPGTSDQTGLNRDDLWSSDSNFLQGDSKLDTDDSYLRKGVTFSNAVC